jgi:hypothetical protein
VPGMTSYSRRHREMLQEIRDERPNEEMPE